MSVTVMKPKEKEKEKERVGKELFLLEKQPPDNVLPRSSAAPGTDLPSGTQQAFIGSEERPTFSTPGSDDADA